MMKQLAKLRRKKHLSQPVLAEKLGITVKELSEWESGATIPESQLTPLADALDVAPETLANVLQAHAARKTAGYRHVFGKKTIAVVFGCLAVLLLAGVVLAAVLTQNQTVAVNGNIGGSANLSPKSIMGEPSAPQETQPLPEASGNESISSGEEGEVTFSQSEQMEQQISPQSGTQPQDCSHTFIMETVRPSCTKQGCTVHTCSKCGYRYTDAYTAPQHDYGKYLCDYCGHPDPSQPYYSLSAWVVTQIPPEDIHGYYLLPYRDEKGLYYIWCWEDMSSITFRYEGAQAEEYLFVSFENNGMCQLGYTNQYATGMAEVKKSAVSSSMQLELDSFSLRSGNGSEEAFMAEMLGKIDELMNTIQDKLLLPNVGFGLKQLGFTAYS
ncbi:MAG: helix-turn-helix domain-containing protein [Oscillospiraceae bacterium]|jgi:transcriptional regulator with XRE-family HTH domain